MLTLIVNFILVALTTLLLLVYFSTFKKTLPKKTFVNLIALLIFDCIFTLSLILLVHLKVPLIVLQINKLLIYISMAGFYYMFTTLLHIKIKLYKISLTLLLLTSSFLYIKSKKSGDTFTEEVKIVTLKDVKNEPIYYLSLKNDVTLEKQYLEQLIYLTRHDDLTNIYRRNHFINLIDEDVENNQEQDRFFILFDINDFKGINDLYGHLTGDKALVYFADMLKKAFDCNTYLCRIGGDEFAAYIYDCNEKTVHKMINKFITLLKENPFSDDDLTIDIRAAIGATKVFTPYLYNRIYDRADKYLYKAKTKQFSFVVKDF